MNSFRNNPDSPENEAMTTDNERAVFAAQMQGREPTEADETEFTEYKARYAQAKQTVLAAQMQAKADALLECEACGGKGEVHTAIGIIWCHWCEGTRKQ